MKTPFPFGFRALVRFGLASWMTGLVLALAAHGANTFEPTGSLSLPRSGHTSTVLPDGNVLAAGGFTTGNVALASAELYNPATGAWVPTGSFLNGRLFHTATLLASGKVLLAGGFNGGSPTNTALYNPVTGNWDPTGPLGVGRSLHTATLLANGKVLVAGGDNAGVSLASAEVYDPAMESWTATGPLVVARNLHTATLLSNGKVLVAGGTSGATRLASVEIYDPATEMWTLIGPMGIARSQHTATLLPNGKVLAAGGLTTGSIILATAEIYDPVGNSWSGTGSLGTGRRIHTATLLPTGKVLAVGGLGTGSSFPATAELYDVSSGAWSPGGTLGTGRYNHASSLLPGRLLVSGGTMTGTVYTASAEIYDFRATVSTQPASAVTARAAALNGVANPNGDNASAWFEWGTTTNYGNTTAAQPAGSGVANTNFSQILSNLTPGPTYHFRAVASNSLGVVYGTDQSFFWTPNVLYTWAGTGNVLQWFRSFGAAGTSATLANPVQGELTITETSATVGGSQAFSDDFNRVREAPSGVSGGLDLLGWDYLEFELGHNGAGNINVQFYVQATPSSSFVALGPDLTITPGVNTYQVPLSGLTAAQAVYIRTIGMNFRDHAALGNVVWTLREVRATGTPLATRNLETFDGTIEGGLQGAIVNFDGAAVLGNNGGQNQTGLSHNPADTGSLQWTDLASSSGGAIAWGNGTAWNGNTFNNRITDLSSFDTMLIRISATGTGGSLSVQAYFQTGAGFSYQTPGTQSLPIDGQFHDLTFSLAGLTDLNVVDLTGVNLGAHSDQLVMNIDLVRFDVIPLQIISIQKLGADIAITFRTSPGHKYFLEYSPTLSPASWATLGNVIVGDGQNVTITDAGAAADEGGYYRLRQLQ